MLGIKDEEFVRGKVPMTKEEVRVLSISKLRPEKNAIIYDIGAGTGSVSIEMALLDSSISVYAIERNEEAISLMEANKEKFGCENMHIIHACAPDGLDSLPSPTHVFIGGSQGRLEEILDCLYKKNANCKVVMNAVTMESIAQAHQILSTLPICEPDLVQVQVSRVKEVGRYHMMQANNPVYIVSFRFKENV